VSACIKYTNTHTIKRKPEGEKKRRRGKRDEKTIKVELNTYYTVSEKKEEKVYCSLIKRKEKSIIYR
jgi:hypothetical protein